MFIIMLQLIIGIAFISVLLVAIPIFAYVLAVGLALAVLYALIQDYRKQEKKNGN